MQHLSPINHIHGCALDHGPVLTRECHAEINTNDEIDLLLRSHVFDRYNRLSLQLEIILERQPRTYGFHRGSRRAFAV